MLSRVFYESDDHTFCAAEFESDDEIFTATGALPDTEPGTCYVLEGTWVDNAKYGRQFQYGRADIVMPETKGDIERFLASGVIEGIGEKTAAAIVGRFGEKSLMILGSDPYRLTEIDGIGDKKAAKIAASFSEHMGFIDIAAKLSEIGITPAAARKIYDEFGDASVEAVKSDPYRLIGTVSGIGFRKADEIAAGLGVDSCDPNRIASGIRCCLLEYADKGNVYVPEDILLEKTAALLDITREHVKDRLDALAFGPDRTVVVDKVDGVNAVYLYYYYKAETDITRNIRVLSETEPAMINVDIDSVITSEEHSQNISLTEGQRGAIREAASSGILVITGGPGTGKTTIIRNMIRVFSSAGLDVKLAAPTGRAAKRMEEATGYPASTIHRMLEYYRDEDTGQMRFGRDADEPLECDALIVDEASMIDLLLMKGLTDAVAPGTRLVLTGDVDQLPPVQAGNVLRDMINSGCVKTVKLDKIFRQAEGSIIIDNAYRINRGEEPVLDNKSDDFYFLTRQTPASIKDTIVDLVSRRLPNYYSDFDPLSDIQVLTPVHKGIVGTEELNAALQQALNPPDEDKPEKKWGSGVFRCGDKVMQMKNDYQMEWEMADGTSGMGVFNGDIGVIDDIDTDEGIVTVIFDGEKEVNYDSQQLQEIELAYAVTVHKSQGSQFPAVVMPASDFPPMLAVRNLLYTAVTRAESLVVMVGRRQCVYDMVKNNSAEERYSGLAYRLGKLAGDESGLYEFEDGAELPGGDDIDIDEDKFFEEMDEMLNFDDEEQPD
ncbi:MAG: ATP-dependent RecD-like DNA helicase [Anaerovoracaceae bacterium]